MRGILSNRSVLRISGDDARPFLQGLVTQDVLRAVDGDGVFTALLSPQGKILFDLFLTPQGDGFLIDCCADAAPTILARFAQYKLRARVMIEPAAELAIAIGEVCDPLASFEDPRAKGLPARAIVQRADMSPADDEYDALRVALGVPEFGKDFSGEEMFLLDVNYDALNAVSYKKGCFIGQEVTSRMKRKGEIRKRTLIATFEGAMPAKGAAVMAGEGSIGEILSGRDGSALALIRLARLEDARQERRALSVEGRALQISFPAYLEHV